MIGELVGLKVSGPQVWQLNGSVRDKRASVKSQKAAPKCFQDFIVITFIVATPFP